MTTQIEHRADGTTRFLAQAGLMGGRWFSLYDVRIVAGRSRKTALGSPAATHRVVVQADRGRWTYPLQVPDSRVLDAVAVLERQLQAATYRMPDTRRIHPRSG